MKKKICLLLLVLSSSLLALKAQNRHLIDSLQNELKKFETRKNELGSKATPLCDSTKVSILLGLCKEYRAAKFDSAIYYARQALALSEKIGFKKGLGDTYYGIGVIYAMQPKYEEAVTYYQQALKIEEELGDKRSMATTCRSMGRAFTNSSNFPEGLKYFLLRLKLDIEIGDKVEVAIAYNDVSVIYAIIKDYPNAIKNQLAYMDICMKLGHPDWISYLHLANDYLLLGNYAEALKYSSMDLKMGEENKDSDRIENSYIVLGKIDLAKGNYDSALENYSNSMRLTEIQGSKPGLVSFNCFNIGEVYEKKGDFQTALKNYLKGLPQVQLLNLIAMQNAYKDLESVSEKLHNYKDYHDYEILYRQIYDTINSSENLKIMNGMRMQYEFDKEQDSVKQAKIRQQDSVKAAEIIKEEAFQRKEQAQYLGIFVIVLLFISFAFLGSRFQLSLKVIDYTGFVGVLLFFEFLHVLLHPIIEKYSTGYPIIFMAINISLAAAIKPLHSIVQKRVISAAHGLKEKRQQKALLLKIKAQKAAEELALKKTQHSA